MSKCPSLSQTKEINAKKRRTRQSFCPQKAQSHQRGKAENERKTNYYPTTVIAEGAGREPGRERLALLGVERVPREGMTKPFVERSRLANVN